MNDALVCRDGGASIPCIMSRGSAVPVGVLSIGTQEAPSGLVPGGHRFSGLLRLADEMGRTISRAVSVQTRRFAPCLRMGTSTPGRARAVRCIGQRPTLTSFAWVRRKAMEATLV